MNRPLVYKSKEQQLAEALEELARLKNAGGAAAAVGEAERQRDEVLAELNERDRFIKDNLGYSTQAETLTALGGKKLTEIIIELQEEKDKLIAEVEKGNNNTTNFNNLLKKKDTDDAKIIKDQKDDYEQQLRNKDDNIALLQPIADDLNAFLTK
jgi:hypothetical protein